MRKKYILTLKYILPIACTILIAIVFIWPSFYSTFSASPKSFRVLLNAAKQINYCSVDSKNRPFTIAATFAEEISPNEIILNNIEASLELDKTHNLKLYGKKGLYNKLSKSLLLNEEVSLEYSNGVIFKTSEAMINFEEGTSENNSEIQGFYKDANLKAARFKILEGGKKIIFFGRPILSILKS